MTKQEAIHQAWINLIGEIGFSLRKDKIDDNGYIRYVEPRNLNVRSELCEKHPSRIDWERWRPKSLIGIEDNNGWTKIESEADLPEQLTHVVAILTTGDIEDSAYWSGSSTVYHKYWFMATYSHWRVIVDFPKPLY